MFSVRPQHCQPGNNLPPEPPVCQAGLGIRLPRLNCLPSRAGRQTRPLPRASLSLRRRAAATSPRPWWTTTTMSPAKGKTQNGTSTAACNELYNRFTSQSTKACCKSKLSLFYWKYLCQKLYTSDLGSCYKDPLFGLLHPLFGHQKAIRTLHPDPHPGNWVLLVNIGVALELEIVNGRITQISFLAISGMWIIIWFILRASFIT